MCLNKSCLNPLPKPAAAFAAKYCAVIENVRPIAANKSNTPPIFKM